MKEGEIEREKKNELTYFTVHMNSEGEIHPQLFIVGWTLSFFELKYD
jgi:hypothetical protein